MRCLSVGEERTPEMKRPLCEPAVINELRHALDCTMTSFFQNERRNISTRNEELLRLIEKRVECEVWPYNLCVVQTAGKRIAVRDMAGRLYEGLDFVSVDYLGLGRSPVLAEVAHRTIAEYGVHTLFGGPMIQGNGQLTALLRLEIADWLGKKNVLFFPTGWLANFSGVKSILRSGDSVVLDEKAHQGLYCGALASQNKIFQFRHLDLVSARDALFQARNAARQNASVLLLTDGLFHRDSTSYFFPDLLQICREFDAFVIVNASHDLGCMGPDGRGIPGQQNVLHEVDMVVGSFSKTMGTSGGFIACDSRSLHRCIQISCGLNADATLPGPINEAVARKAIRIIRSAEGERLRYQLAQRYLWFREEAEKKGLICLGKPSPVVSIAAGPQATARLVWKNLINRGIIAPLIENSEKPSDMAHLRLTLNPTFTQEEISDTVNTMKQSIDEAEELLKNV